MFDFTRACSSSARKKDRYTKKELMDLKHEYHITLPKAEMTITELCNFYKTLNWEELKEKNGKF